MVVILILYDFVHTNGSGVIIATMLDIKKGIVAQQLHQQHPTTNLMFIIINNATSIFRKTRPNNNSLFTISLVNNELHRKFKALASSPSFIEFYMKENVFYQQTTSCCCHYLVSHYTRQTDCDVGS